MKVLKKSVVSGIIVFFLTISLFSCDEDTYESKGTIIGPDLRLCVCCGGWIIEIDKKAYNFDTLPDNSGIDLEHETFPIYVQLDWEIDKPACAGNEHIAISRVAKR